MAKKFKYVIFLLALSIISASFLIIENLMQNQGEVRVETPPSSLPSTIGSSNLTERMPIVDELIIPRYLYDGNYTFINPYGNFSWTKPYFFKYAFRSAIKNSVFLVQEDSTGNWRLLLTITNVVISSTNSSLTFSCQIYITVLRRTYIVASVRVILNFVEKPKITLILEKTNDWETVGLGRSRWVWVIAVTDKWKYLVNDSNKTNLDITQNAELSYYGTASQLWIANTSLYDFSKQTLEINWVAIKRLAKIYLGNLPLLNSRGILIVFDPELNYLDPVTVGSSTVAWATRWEGQHKVFRNPRGTKYFYAFCFTTTYLNYRISPDGSSWYGGDTLKNFGTGVTGESADIRTRDNGTLLLVYSSYTDSNGLLFYRRGYLLDVNTLITWESEQTLFSESGVKAFFPQITLAKDNYVHVAYEKVYDVGPATYELYVDGFDHTDEDWSTSGSEPWLNAVGGGYIYVSTTGSFESYFSFQDGTSEADIVNLQLYAYGDGGDYVNVYLDNGVTEQLMGAITPGTVYSWKSLDVSTFLSDLNKTNLAKMKLVKITAGKANPLYVDAARLELYISKYNVVLKSSTVTFNPTSTQWSTEYLVHTSSANYPMLPAIAPFASTRDLWYVWIHHWWSAGDLYVGIGAKEIDWNGVAHSIGYVQTQFSLGSVSDNKPPAIVVDETYNKGWVLVRTPASFHGTEELRWTVGSGWDSGYSTLGLYGTSYSLTVDTNANPNVVYAYLLKSGSAPFNTFMLRKKAANQPVTDVWGMVIDSVADNSESIAYFSASYNAVSTGTGVDIPLIYTRQDTSPYYIRFYVYTYSLGFALNLRAKDWDLTDPIQGAYVYKDSESKISNSAGWANWTTQTGIVQIKVRYYGYWVNGTFSVNMDSDKTIDVKCNLYDVLVTVKPNNNQGVVTTAKVSAFNATLVEIKNAISQNWTGQASLTNLPNNTLTFKAYAKSDYSIQIASTTQLINSDGQTFNLVANENYATTQIEWQILIIASVVSFNSKKVHKKCEKLLASFRSSSA